MKQPKLSDSQEIALREANFIVYGLANLPDRYDIINDNFRRQNQREDYPRCSYRIILYDKELDREVIVKEFNYDWAPPAYSCPLLWANHIKFDKNRYPTPYPVNIKNKIAWIGNNYRLERALSLIINKTTIEISIKNDSEGDDESLKTLATHLKELDLDKLSDLLSKTYAELSYAGTGRCNMIHVPISFWSCSLSNKLSYQKAYSYSAVPYFAKNLVLDIPDYKLDSLFTNFVREKNESEGRLEFIYTKANDKDENIRVLIWRKNEGAYH